MTIPVQMELLGLMLVELRVDKMVVLMDKNLAGKSVEMMVA